MVGAAKFLDGPVPERNAVASSQLEHQLRLETPFDVDVQLGFRNAADQFLDGVPHFFRSECPVRDTIYFTARESVFKGAEHQERWKPPLTMFFWWAVEVRVSGPPSPSPRRIRIS